MKVYDYKLNYFTQSGELNNVAELPKVDFFENLFTNGVNNYFELIENPTDFEQAKSKLNTILSKNLVPLVYVSDVLKMVEYFDDLVLFLSEHKLKTAIKVGHSLFDLGECDKVYKKSMVNLLEDYGLLDNEPIIVSGVHLIKDDIDLLINYNVSFCLTLKEDMQNGVGVPSIVSMLKSNNVFLSYKTDEMFLEMFLLFAVPAAWLNQKQIVSHKQVLKIVFGNAIDQMRKFKNIEINFETYVAQENVTEQFVVECGTKLTKQI